MGGESDQRILFITFYFTSLAMSKHLFVLCRLSGVFSVTALLNKGTPAEVSNSA